MMLLLAFLVLFAAIGFVSFLAYGAGVVTGGLRVESKRLQAWADNERAYDSPGGRDYLLNLTRVGPASVDVAGVVALGEWVQELTEDETENDCG